MNNSIKKVVLGLAGATILAVSAQAGGFSRGTADTDILFEEGNFNMRAGVTIVNPTRKHKSDPNPALNGVDPLESYTIPSFGVKLSVNDASCAFTMTDAYGGSANYAPTSTAGGKTLEKFTVSELGATCGYKVDLSKGFITLIGGVFLEQFNYELQTVVPTTTNLSGEDVGYRLGIAYSIPEIALRAQLLYRSGTSHTPTGISAGPGPSTLPASGRGNLPQSVELKVQTGVAPGWLVFGSVKWTDWSVLDTLDLNAGYFTSANEYYYRDGWTVSAGVGHAFSEMVSGFGAVQWDRGVGTGYDGASDTWTVASGVTLKPNEHTEFTFAGSYTYITAATETAYAPGSNRTYDSGNAYGLTASFKAKF